MRFMMIIKADKQSESGRLPSTQVLEAMGRYNEELIKAGVMLAGEGLHPSSRGFLVDKRGTDVQIVDGPFSEAKELVAGYWIIQTRTREEAIEWAKRVPFEAAAPGDAPGQIELRQIFELSDFPVQPNESGWREEEEQLRAAPPPVVDDRKQKYILFFRADARSERGVLPTEAEMAAMGEVIGDMARQGVLLGCEGLHPTSKGTRIFFDGDGARRVVDGPFAEAKEIIAGFTLIQVASKEEAIEWSKRGLFTSPIDGANEVRRVFTEADFGELVQQVPAVFEQERAFREAQSRA